MSRHLHHRRQHEHHHRGHDKDASEVATVVSVVYKTASQTFAGSIGGYVTVTSSPPQTSQAQAPTPSPTPTSQASPPDTTTQRVLSTTALPGSASIPGSIATSSTLSASSPAPVTTTLTTSLNTSVNTRDSTVVFQSISTSPTLSADLTPSSTLASTPTQSPTKVLSSNAGGTTTGNSSGGLSGGAKAGIAIGVLLGIGAVLGLLLFCYRRHKNQHHETEEQAENEKNPFGDNAAIPAFVTPASQPAQCQPATSDVSTPPQLSLRPVTQFQPELLSRSGKAADVPGITGAKIAGTTAAEHANQPMNPFEDRVATAPAAASNEPSSINHAKPTTGEIPASLRIRTPSPESEAGVVAGAAIAQRHNTPKPLDIKRTVSPAPSTPMAAPDAAAPSPAVTEFSMTSVSATSITSGPGAMNVHRIQLDFKPSMDDELELRAGQLVRLLHEYDDGWALCIRLDRSQQGVAPRTCLSTRPVKPRAKGPPRNGTPEGPRFASAAAQNSHSSSPLAERSAQPIVSAAQRSGLPALNIGAAQQSNVPNAASLSESGSVSLNTEVPTLQPTVQRKPVGS